MIEAQGSRYPGEPIRSYFDSEHEVWRERAAQDPAETGLFVLPLAPDRVLKENVSGGPPYGFVLPDGCADGLFAAETTMPFVSYLTARLAARSQSRAGDRAVCSGVVLAASCPALQGGAIDAVERVRIRRRSAGRTGGARPAASRTVR